MTVKELKAALDSFPDDMVVVTQGGIWDEFWNPTLETLKRSSYPEYMYNDIEKSDDLLLIGDR